MKIIKFFKDVPLAKIPQVSNFIDQSKFGQLTLEQIRSDEDLFYDFLESVVSELKI